MAAGVIDVSVRLQHVLTVQIELKVIKQDSTDILLYHLYVTKCQAAAGDLKTRL